MATICEVHCIDKASFRETSDPSGTAQNEQNNKPSMAPLVAGDRNNEIIWRGSKLVCILKLSDV